MLYSGIASNRYIEPGEMESGKYQPLDTAPYTPYPDNIRLEAAHPQRVTVQTYDVSQDQVGLGCMCCAVCNYLWCPRLGIPALIFAILGQEADKRRDVEAAKSHAYHAKVFNVIWAFLMLFNLCLFLTCVGGLVGTLYAMWEVIVSIEYQLEHIITSPTRSYT